MRVDVDLSAEDGPPEGAMRRLLFVISRFTPHILAVELRRVSAASGRVLLTAQVTFSDGGQLALQTEDEPSAAATRHFIDRFGRAVARRLAARGQR